MLKFAEQRIAYTQRTMESNRELIDKLVAVLKGAAKWSVAPPEFEAPIPDHEHARADAVVRLGGDRLLLVEMKAGGYPRDVRDSIFQLRDYKQALEDHGRDGEVLPLFVSAHITENARELLRRHGVGYFDSSGSMHLEAENLLIHMDRPPSKPIQRKAVSIFTGAREQILLTLFAALPAWRNKDPDDGWRPFSELLLQARTSKSTLSETLAELERREVVAVRGEDRGRSWRITRPGLLLDEWADSAGKRKEPKSRWYRFVQAPTELIPKLVDELADDLDHLAITGAAAAQLYSPWLTSIENVDLIIPPGRRDVVAKRLGLSKAEKGFNVTLIERAGASTMHKRPPPGRPSLPPILANPFIAYLDAVHGPGRNKELAMQLRSTVLKV